MVTLAVAASAILTVIFLVRKRQLADAGGKRLSYHFFDKSLEFLIPFTVIGSLFVLLSLLVSGTSDKTTIQRLILFEQMIGFFKRFVSVFKVSAVAAAALLLLFYLISLTRIPSRYTSKFIPFFKKYQKVVKTASVIVIILFSFTFFGTQAGEPAALLKFRKDEAEGKYGGLREEVSAAVSQEVTRKLLEKVKASLPPDYRRDLDEQEQYFVYVGDLRTRYEEFKTNYRGRDPGAEAAAHAPPPDPPPGPRGGDKPGGGETVGERPQPPAPEVGPGKPAGKARSKAPDRPVVGGERPPEAVGTGDRIVYELFEEGTPAAAPQPRPVPPQASAEKIDEARSAVRRHRELILDAAVKVVKSEHGRELALQLPKTITGRVKRVVLEVLTDRYPIVEPLLSVFFGTLDKEVETRTARAIDNATASAALNPRDVPRIIDEESSRVVAQTKVSFPRSLLDKAEQAGAKVRAKVRAVKDAVARLTARGARLDAIAQAVEEADEQIALLGCKSEQLRNEAAKKLSEVSRHLSPEQVGRIESLMLDNSVRYRKSRAYRNFYEEVPMGYYAAEAVRRLRTPHLSEGAREIAENIIREVDSVPPGQRVRHQAKVIELAGLADP